MPYSWTFYALNEFIDIIKYIDVLEELFGTTITYYVHNLQKGPDDSDDANRFKKIELHFEFEDSQSKVIIIGNDSLDVPAILSHSGDHDNSGKILIDWFKSEIDVIIWQLKINKKLMIQLADSVIENDITETDLSNRNWYLTKFVFDVTTTVDNNLQKMEFEISKDSCQKLGKNAKHPYSEAIIPYIYENTGLDTIKLPLSSISFTNSCKITESNIITIPFSIKSNLLITFLLETQPNNSKS
ncbi:hypothetical protein Kpol_1065p19 [Vanderwaltozyma polyspora DSM 70294]|uniref:Uncharacterized protein n=1 Tax=Vanderwaltozyma polyspora (strain ATCC 22028 / DSM 70294 / BCRC 21397 / CBS 2163 / NBRC 10782 / NRRL Y-8283 / UCD 57-17) TaxID=436907 RepID=A7TL41_VANPO|nr:uncharacterized protein Kpol_1065p19 [Vanderwaltozyma polyspora DSM 70294]EDO17004.1 hypothetical protein Kpol_1065p19 [Vanderwaltozyma polyspora DSM 70294]